VWQASSVVPLFIYAPDVNRNEISSRWASSQERVLGAKPFIFFYGFSDGFPHPPRSANATNPARSMTPWRWCCGDSIF
jgi:hypothetical protein